MLLARTPCFSFSYSSCTVQHPQRHAEPHSSKGRPAWSPSMLLVAAVAAVAVVPPLSAPCSSSRAHCCRASKRARCRSRHTLAATQVLAKLCGALSLRRSLRTLCTLAAPLTHHFSTRCRCSPCRAPSAAARAMCSDTRRRLEEAQGAGAGAGQQGEPVEQYGDALGVWLVEGCVDG